MIRAILYDAVGTLIHVQPSVAAIYAEVGRRFGSQLNSDEVCRRFPLAFTRQDRLDEATNWRTSEARERLRWRDIVAEVLDDVADPAGCCEVLFNTFSEADAWTCDPCVGDLFFNMHQRGIRQAIASNFDGRLPGLIRAMPALRSLTPIFVSSEIGWRKPAPEFFVHVIDSMQLSAREILFVGDDRVNDYDAAKSAGMHAVLFDPGRQHLHAGVERIDGLGELLSRV